LTKLSSGSLQSRDRGRVRDHPPPARHQEGWRSQPRRIAQVIPWGGKMR